MEKLKIFLIDDHAVVREGMKRLIDAAPGMETVGESDDGAKAIEAILQLKPDIALIDVNMPGMSGVETTRALKREMPEVKVVALTVHEDTSYLRELMEAGISGYVLKRAAADELTQALKAVSGGSIYVDPRMMTKFVSTFVLPKSNSTKLAGEITDRETEVLRRVARGFTNKEIAADMGVSVKTIETYKSRAREKLGLRSRAEIVRLAAERGWV